jgi:probable phosphoglycerate mutase
LLSPAERAGAAAATRVLAIRHGETAWNVEGRMQGQLDLPLNATGRRQAERLARALAESRLDAIYASDLQRARSTAEAVALACGLPLGLDEGLRERCFGSFEGLTFDEVQQRWPDEARRWRRREPDFAPAGGESLSRFSARCVAAARRLAAAHPGETVALVAHGGVLDCLYRDATRIELQAPRTWQLGNAAINRLLYTPGGFTLIGWGDTQHLDAIALDEADGSDGESATEGQPVA